MPESLQTLIKKSWSEAANDRPTCVELFEELLRLEKEMVRKDGKPTTSESTPILGRRTTLFMKSPLTMSAEKAMAELALPIDEDD